MGTRCTIQVKDTKNGKPYLTIYKQFDGYFSGIGKDIKNKFQNHIILNGHANQSMETHANGMGCFAAQLVAFLKDAVGNVYIKNTADVDEKEGHNYIIYENKKHELDIYANAYDEVIYEGSLKSFDPIIEDKFYKNKE